MRRVLVVVPFAMSADNLLLRQAQLQGLQFGEGIRFEYRAVKAGPLNYSSHHDFVLADVANFEAGCRAQEDGAEVLILGSTTMHQSHVWLSERLPVPVINPGPLSYKMAESMLALGLCHSAVGYTRPMHPRLDMLSAMMEAGSRSLAVPQP